MPDTHDPDKWRTAPIPKLSPVAPRPGDTFPPVCDKPTDLYPPVRLRAERDQARELYHVLRAAVHEYFEAADAWEAAVQSRSHDEATHWGDRRHASESALRRLVGMEVRDET